ncbi:hypothetical protein TREMEDRAFT_65006 [Tremella mesenterica DSM 1558]|uniref:uncharacterized protein n=1 Tax=Tremella mesenterica (strain ATCC 24925 / CBS 8224 / DSM 1558 / NBRC 9311 / NRRL Y-6157 / RJB 2259-6 / UBC 559-6) TaxID=578456 RepID=UPI0003F49DCA|nr:uncharacterized protein TREMEDRAFT_65006 [Tremella mesenterica DSM 1558]EIW67137.1 hypothetical protein TREMEDRAFT_65006 [Tremella mesenterica DSM 1558]
MGEGVKWMKGDLLDRVDWSQGQADGIPQRMFRKQLTPGEVDPVRMVRLFLGVFNGARWGTFVGILLLSRLVAIDRVATRYPRFSTDVLILRPLRPNHYQSQEWRLIPADLWIFRHIQSGVDLTLIRKSRIRRSHPKVLKRSTVPLLDAPIASHRHPSPPYPISFTPFGEGNKEAGVMIRDRCPDDDAGVQGAVIHF